MRSMKSIILFIFIGFTCFTGFAQDVSFTAAAPAKVGMGQNFQVQYTINKQADKIEPGNYSDFNLINGPSISTSQNIQIINGAYTQKNTYTYTYVFQPKNVGKFTIAAASATIDGKAYSSNAVSIEIQKDPVQTQNNRRQNSYDPFADLFNQTQPNTSSAPKELTGEDLFVRVIPDKTSLYKGEPLTLLLKIYTKVDLSAINDIKFPSLNSFYTEELESVTHLNFVNETYNGKNYKTAVIKKYLLYPRVAGNLSIEPCEAECVVRQATSGANGYYSPFYSYYENVTKFIKSAEIKINVKDLPKASEDFSGAIGSFSIKMTQSADTANVNDAVTFKLVLSGTGNFNMIEIPKIIWPKEFEVYEPTISDQTKSSAAGITGSKTWEYTIVPRYPGIFKLGSVNFLYFNSGSKQYVKLNTDEITLAVRKDKNDTGFGDKDYNYSQKNVDYIGNDDIRFIKKDDLNLKKDYKPLIKKSYFSLFYILPFIMFVILSILLRKRIKENANYALMKVKHAGKTSRRRLKKAKKFMLLNNKSEFYKEVISALWGYIGDRFNVPVADLTKEKISDVLINAGIDNGFINNFILLIEKCEFTHFSPASAETELINIYDETVNLIEELEQKIK